MMEPSTEDLWGDVDRYVVERLAPPDDALEAALAANAAAGLPPIDVSPAQGKLLQLLARMIGARRILEIGTLGGYSTICLARGLPEDGALVSLELEQRHAAVARKNVERAGLSGKVEIHVGPALETLPALVGEAPFDLFFIDADKESNADYVAWAIRLSRPGSVVIVDNVVRNGALIDAKSDDPRVAGARRVIDYVAAEPRFDATVLQTVGVKGWDGFIVALVKG